MPVKTYDSHQFCALFPGVKSSRIMAMVWDGRFNPEYRGKRGYSNGHWFSERDVDKIYNFLETEKAFLQAKEDLKL